MLKILHARLQHDVNQELPDVQDGFRKDRGTRDQIASICWIIEKARKFHKIIYLCFIDCTKAFDCVDHGKLWKALKEMGIPDHLACLWRNLYVGHDATIRTLYGMTDWFRNEKGVQGCWLLSPCLFNLYAEHITTMPGWVSYKLESRLPCLFNLYAEQITTMTGWVSYKLESRLPEISTISDMQMIPL